MRAAAGAGLPQRRISGVVTSVPSSSSGSPFARSPQSGAVLISARRAGAGGLAGRDDGCLHHVVVPFGTAGRLLRSERWLSGPALCRLMLIS
jgi:hypothetical protein